MAAKTMTRIVLIAVLLIVLAAGACFGLVMYTSHSPFEGVRTAVLNTLLDTTGMKNTIDSELRSRAYSLADQYSIPHELVDQGVDILAIPDWEVVDTPEMTSSTKTLNVDVDGSPVQVTLYEDPSLISLKGEGKLNTFGQTVTFKMPESAQGAASVLPLLDTAQDLGLPELAESLGILQ